MEPRLSGLARRWTQRPPTSSSSVRLSSLFELALALIFSCAQPEEEEAPLWGTVQRAETRATLVRQATVKVAQRVFPTPEVAQDG